MLLTNHESTLHFTSHSKTDSMMELLEQDLTNYFLIHWNMNKTYNLTVNHEEIIQM